MMTYKTVKKINHINHVAKRIVRGTSIFSRYIPRIGCVKKKAKKKKNRKERARRVESSS